MPPGAGKPVNDSAGPEDKELSPYLGAVTPLEGLDGDIQTAEQHLPAERVLILQGHIDALQCLPLLR